jgi:TatD DNase family protein
VATGEAARADGGSVPPLPAPAVDSHGHLSDPRLAPAVEAILDRALAAGVAWVVDPGVDVESSERALAHARRFPDRVRAAVGVHPHEAAVTDEAAWRRIESLAADPLCVAIGEVGLDAYRVLSPPAAQEAALERCLDLARRVGKPVLLHVRDAYGRALQIIDAAGPVRGVVHAFWGDRATAEAFLARGFRIGVGGAATFRREANLRATLATLPPGSILLETDAPYLAPEPVRGRTNEPAFVSYTARSVAQTRGVDLAAFVAETTAATAQLLSWPDWTGPTA